MWDIHKGRIDTEALSKADHIIHLAGAGVMDKEWTESYKKEIVESRTKSSELLIKALKENKHKVQTFVSASAIGWYGSDEENSPPAGGFIEANPAANNFLGETCLLWEKSLDPLEEMNIRVVKLRTGIVLSNQGGAFKEFRRPIYLGIAAVLGSGRQVISWIHIDDLCRMYIYSIRNSNMQGSFNAVAPEPVSNKEMVLNIAKRLRHHFFIPVNVPKLFIQLLFGQRAFEIMKSTTVSCKKIKAEGFTFLYPSLKIALDELCSKQHNRN